MDPGSPASTFATTVDLIGVLAWPLVILFVLVRYGAAIGRFINHLGSFSIKAGGVEMSAERAATVAVELERATVKQGVDSGDRKQIAAVAVDATRPDALRQLRDKAVLWVDDIPGNNVLEREALEATGLRVETSRSTDDALSHLAADPFDLVISDMSRPPDDRAGYALLDAMRARSLEVPVVFYTSPWFATEKGAEARARGARGVTGRPADLVALVVRALTER